jgi:hypothetical protein
MLEGTLHMSSSGLRKQHNRQLNICWKEQYICLHLDWGNNTIDNWISVWKEQYICLHLNWENNTIDNWISVGGNNCSFQTDIQLSIVLFPQSRWRHMYCSFQQIFNCLLCCFLNPDEDICTVPSNIYSIVYYVVLSIQMKTYALFPPTDIQLSIVLFSQSRWRHMYCSLQQIFNCLLGCYIIDNWISVGGNSTYVFIWIERTTQ